ncbi:MAG: RNA-binding S4 domain-containing protein [Ruminococcaceae bacterium]|nr:RNA-binding S4 domain-containing protein [Oscillospiraceae bacterium]
MEINKISIKEDFIRLDSAMKLGDMVVTGGHAKIVIQEGEVKVNGQVCTMRGKKLHKGDKIEFEGNLVEII